MFERHVTGILTQVLGNYVEPSCFRHDKVNVGVWSGYVVLQSLELKRKCYPLFGVSVLRGVIGSVTIKIPWNRLVSDSVLVTIDDVYVQLNTIESDRPDLLEDPVALKKKLIRELYNERKKLKESLATDNENQDSFAVRIRNKIIDNLEFHVRRIHIRIQDDKTGDHPFTFGLAIESLHIQSTNSKWQPTYVDVSATKEALIYKTIELNHLCVYLNPDCKINGTLLNFETCSSSTFTKAFSLSIPKRYDEKTMYTLHPQHHFILKPIDARAKMKVKRDPNDTSLPNLELEVIVDEIAMVLEESQYCDMLFLASALKAPQYAKQFLKYKQFRPTTSVLKSPKLWWEYAINCLLLDIHTKKLEWSWDNMRARRDDRLKYINLWQRKQRYPQFNSENITAYDDTAADTDIEHERMYCDKNDSSFITDKSTTTDASSESKTLIQSPLTTAEASITGPLAVHERSMLDEIEKNRTVEDVLLFRYLADLESRVDNSKASSNDTDSECGSNADSNSKQTLSSWGNMWQNVLHWSSSAKSAAGTEEHDGDGETISNSKIPELELRELYHILGYDPASRKHASSSTSSSNAVNVSDIVVSRISFSMGKGSVRLFNDAKTKKYRNDLDYSSRYDPIPFILAEFQGLNVTVLSKVNSMKIDTSLYTIEVFDECAAKGSAFSRILTPKLTLYNNANSSFKHSVHPMELHNPVFLLSYETNSNSNASANAALVLQMEPLEIVYAPTAICWTHLSTFMNAPEVLGLWAEMEVAALNELVNSQARNNAKLEYVMANRIAVAIELRIQAPVFIIPESDTDFYCSRLIVDLGLINFRTERISKLKVNGSSQDFTVKTPRSASNLITYRQDLNSSTSFAKQLYDEAETGEGATRWKEEFYDKFNVNVSNIHVLLIPYNSNSSSNLYEWRSMAYVKEHHLQLIDPFNINVTLRTSVLPLDATLYRMYVHADLPALTINMSLSKYCIISKLMERFTSNTSEQLKNDVIANTTLNSSSLNISKLKQTIHDGGLDLDANAQKPTTVNLDEWTQNIWDSATTQNDVEDMETKSNDSNETWFSITSDNGVAFGEDQFDSIVSMDSVLNPKEIIVPNMNRNSANSLAELAATAALSKFTPLPLRNTTLKKNVIDRRLFVCTFTIPLVHIHFQKSIEIPKSFSFMKMENETMDPGVLTFRLEGSNIRFAKKTFHSNISLRLRAFEVEDYTEVYSRESQFVIFSCPTIDEPFTATLPQRHRPPLSGNKHPRYYKMKHRKKSFQKETIFSFRANMPITTNPSNAASSASIDKELPPEYLLNFVIATKTTVESVQSDIDITVGVIHFQFDQSRIAALIDLVQLASTFDYNVSTVASRDALLIAEGGNNMELPPLELTPSVSQEYFSSMRLTDSVRLDLEKARMHLLYGSNTSNARQNSGGSKNVVTITNISVYVHSISACLSNRNEDIMSLGLLQLRVKSTMKHNSQEPLKQSAIVSGSVHNIKVFDLTAMPPTTDMTRLTPLQSANDSFHHQFVEIFGLINSSKSNSNIITFDVSNTEVSSKAYTQWNVNLSISSVRYVFHAQYLLKMLSYVHDGPIAMLLRLTASSSAASAEESKKATYHEYEYTKSGKKVSTPFFDAVGSMNSARDEYSGSVRPVSNNNSSGKVDEQEGRILCFLSFELSHPMIVMPLNDDLLRFSQGLVIDLGVIHGSVGSKRCGGVVKRDIRLDVTALNVRSNHDEFKLLSDVHFQLMCQLHDDLLTKAFTGILDDGINVASPTSSTSSTSLNDCFVKTDKIPMKLEELVSYKAIIGVYVSPLQFNITEPHAAFLVDFYFSSIFPVLQFANIAAYESKELSTAADTDATTTTSTATAAKDVLNSSNDYYVRVNIDAISLDILTSQSIAELNAIHSIELLNSAQATSSHNDNLPTQVLEDPFSSTYSGEFLPIAQFTVYQLQACVTSNNTILNGDLAIQNITISDLSVNHEVVFPQVFGTVNSLMKTSTTNTTITTTTTTAITSSNAVDRSSVPSFYTDEMNSQPHKLSRSNSFPSNPNAASMTSPPDSKREFDTQNPFHSIIPPLFTLQYRRNIAVDISKESFTQSIRCSALPIQIIFVPFFLINLQHVAFSILNTIQYTMAQNEAKLQQSNHLKRRNFSFYNSPSVYTSDDEENSDNLSVNDFNSPPVSYDTNWLREESKYRKLNHSRKNSITSYQSPGIAHSSHRKRMDSFSSVISKASTFRDAQDGGGVEYESIPVIAMKYKAERLIQSIVKCQVSFQFKEIQFCLLENETSVDTQCIIWSCSIDTSLSGISSADKSNKALGERQLLMWNAKECQQFHANFNMNNIRIYTTNMQQLYTRAKQPNANINTSSLWTILEPCDINLRHNWQCLREDQVDLLQTVTKDNAKLGSTDEKIQNTMKFHAGFVKPSSPCTMGTEGVDVNIGAMYHQFETDISQIVTRISYKDFPLIFCIVQNTSSYSALSQTLAHHFNAQTAMYSLQIVRYSSDSNELKGSIAPTGVSKATKTLQLQKLSEIEQLESMIDSINLLPTKQDAITYVYSEVKFVGIQLNMINNMGGQEFPVVNMRIHPVSIQTVIEPEWNSFTSFSIKCEAWYHNLRLVIAEPLIEPYELKVNIISNAKTDNCTNSQQSVFVPSLLIDATSKHILQFNITECFLENWSMANKAWQWATKGGVHDMTDQFSTYWIRNDTGLAMKYWGPQCKVHILEPGEERPLDFEPTTLLNSSSYSGSYRRSRSFTEDPLSTISSTFTSASTTTTGGSSRSIMATSSAEFHSNEGYQHHNQINITALLETDTVNLKWQSESNIPVDRVGPRKYRLCNTVDSFSTRDCECVIDVVVNHGCKYFVVKSKFSIENNTSMELEFDLHTPHMLGFPNEAWKISIAPGQVKPIPIHLVSIQGSVLIVKPVSQLSTLTYESEKLVSLNISEDNPTPVNTTVQFRHSTTIPALYRPFIANVSLSRYSAYERKLSFYPPMVLYNLTGMTIEYRFSTTNLMTSTTTVTSATGTAAIPKTKYKSSKERLQIFDQDSELGGSHSILPNNRRICEAGEIKLGGKLVWHLSEMETAPVHLEIRCNGFEWSQLMQLHKLEAFESSRTDRIKLQEHNSNAALFVCAEMSMTEGECYTVNLYVPYWIVNQTGLDLEFEHDINQLGPEHQESLLAGQSLTKHKQTLTVNDKPNPHVINDLKSKEAIHNQHSHTPPNNSKRQPSTTTTNRGRLLPSLTTMRGFLDLLPKKTTLHNPHSFIATSYTNDRLHTGRIRLRIRDTSSNHSMPTTTISRVLQDKAYLKWSNVLELDMTGANGVLETHNGLIDQVYSIGFSINHAKGVFSRTKVITLQPRYTIVNTLNQPIEIQYANSRDFSSPHQAHDTTNNSANNTIVLNSKNDSFLHWTSHSTRFKTVRFKFLPHGWLYSGVISLSEPGDFVVRLRNPNLRVHFLLRIIVKIEKLGRIFVYLQEANTTPYRIENFSLETLRIHQFQVRVSDVLLPYHSTDYAWDELIPATTKVKHSRKLVVDMLPSAADDNSRPVRVGIFSLDEIQRFPDGLNGKLGIEICADGPTRVLRFTDLRLKASEDPEFQNGSDKLNKLDGIKGKMLLLKFITQPTMNININFRGVGISVISALPRELLYISCEGIQCNILTSPPSKATNDPASIDAATSSIRQRNATLQAIHLQISNIQVDNQLRNTPFPVLLRFSRGNHNITTVSPPVFQLTLVKHNEYVNIEFIRYLAIECLPMHIRIDWSLVSLLASSIMQSSSSSSTSDRSVLQDDTKKLPYQSSAAVNSPKVDVGFIDFQQSTGLKLNKATVIVEKNGSKKHSPTAFSQVDRENNGTQMHTVKKLYFEKLFIDTIKAIVSFSTGHAHPNEFNLTAISNRSMSAERTGASFASMRQILQAVGATLTKIANAPLQLNSLEMNHCFIQPDALVSQLVAHYQSETLRQAYVILGSVDVLGNPVKVWNNVKRGVKDFFYEPAKGLHESPQAFGLGIVRGTTSLVRSIAYSSLDFNTRIVTSVSLGLTEACLKIDTFTGYPMANSIYQGLAQGVSGVVVSPIHAYHITGLRGIFPGFIAGVLGLLLKPILGFSNAIVNTSTTLREALNTELKQSLHRIRPIRYINPRTGRLKPYSYLHSIGEEIMWKIQNGKYRFEIYIGHVDLQHTVYLATKTRIMCLDVTDHNQYQVQWEILSEELVLVDHPEDTMIVLYYKPESFSWQKTYSKGVYDLIIRHQEIHVSKKQALFLYSMVGQLSHTMITQNDVLDLPSMKPITHYPIFHSKFTKQDKILQT